MSFGLLVVSFGLLVVSFDSTNPYKHCIRRRPPITQFPTKGIGYTGRATLLRRPPVSQEKNAPSQCCDEKLKQHVKQSEREPNPDAIKRYPVLSDEDLIYACFPNTTTQNLRVLLKRAQTHWTELEKAGIVRIERLTHGWRILPGASHIEKYRGVKETQKRG